MQEKVKPVSKQRSVTCRMGSHSVICHRTQVNVPCLNPSQILDLPTPELILVLVIHRDGSPVHGQSSSQEVGLLSI